MSVRYLSELKKSKKPRVYKCKFCNARIMWAVTEYRKSIPIVYNPDLEYLYDGIAKVPFVKGLMKPHNEVCRLKDVVKTIYK